MASDTPKILVVEDEPKIAALLQDYLTSNDMHSTIVNDGNDVLKTFAELAPNLVLLDVGLPNKDGLTICREIRAQSHVPIIMLTARVEEIDRLLGLELGADDYICKPFSPREVVARIKAVLRRLEPPEPAADSQQSLLIDPPKMRASLNGKTLNLTPLEFKLLEVMASHQGRVYARAELLDLIYDDYREVSDRTIDSHIKNLRRKLEDAAPELKLIHSVYGIGYRFEPP
ncbi:MAG: response regulator [Pseudomonadota bacterium]